MIDANLEDHLLQFGFRNKASDLEPSGVVYDNVLLTNSRRYFRTKRMLSR